MKKLILFFLLFTQLIFAQELVGNLDINLDKLKSFYYLENPSKKEFVLILKNKENIECLKTDSNFNVLNRLEFPEASKSLDLIGSSIKDNIYYSYWRKDKKTLEVLAIDFNTKNIVKHQMDLSFDSNERDFYSFDKNQSLNYLTLVKGTSIINYYKINGLQIDKKTYDCSSMKFMNALNQSLNFWELTKEQDGIVYTTGFKDFHTDKRNYNAVSSADKKKIFVQEDTILITSDINKNFTQILSLSLKDFTAKQHIITKQDENSTKNFISRQSNSFIIDNKVFIGKFNDDKFSVVVKNLDNEPLFSFVITPTEGQEYINTDLIEEKAGIANRETIENKEKFIRKVFNKNPSISGYLLDGNYYITVAGVSYPKQQSHQLFWMGGLIPGITAAIIGRGEGTSITSYSDKYVTSFTSCISATNYKPTSAKVQKTNFENVRSYVELNDLKENFLALLDSNNHFYLFANKNKKESIKVYKF